MQVGYNQQNVSACNSSWQKWNTLKAQNTLKAIPYPREKSANKNKQLPMQKRNNYCLKQLQMQKFVNIDAKTKTLDIINRGVEMMEKGTKTADT